MYRADSVRAREPEFFPELRLDDGADAFINFHSDSDVCYSFLAAGDFGFVHQVLSFTRRHGDSITAKSTLKLGSWLPGHLLILLRHGPAFLDRREFAARARRVGRRYGFFLLRSALKGRLFFDGRFRAYHRGAVVRLRMEFAAAGLHAWWLALVGVLLG